MRSLEGLREEKRGKNYQINKKTILISLDGSTPSDVLASKVEFPSAIGLLSVILYNKQTTSPKQFIPSHQSLPNQSYPYLRYNFKSYSCPKFIPRWQTPSIEPCFTLRSALWQTFFNLHSLPRR